MSSQTILYQEPFILLKLMWGRSQLFVSWTLKVCLLWKNIAPDLFCTSCQHNVNLSSSEHDRKEGCIFLSSTQRQSTDSCLTWRELYCLPNKGRFQTLTHISVSQKETDRYSSPWNLADFLQEVCEERQGGCQGYERPPKSSQVISRVLVSRWVP